MPEHIKMLKEADLNSTKQPRPQLDETQLDDIERLLGESVEENQCVELTTWKDGFFTLRVGTVTKIDSYEKTIILHDELNVEIKISFFQIVDVQTK